SGARLVAGVIVDAPKTLQVAAAPPASARARHSDTRTYRSRARGQDRSTRSGAAVRDRDRRGTTATMSSPRIGAGGRAAAGRGDQWGPAARSVATRDRTF